MAKKMQYPNKEKMLVIRACIVAICNGDEAASKLLSVLLYWYDHSTDEAQDGDFSIKRTQADLSEDACGLIDVKTIHDRAVPLLILLGYLDVKEQMGGNRYTLHIDRINAAIAAYAKGVKALKAFLKTAAQLENSLIEITPDELENSLINKKILQLQLEKILIRIREFSNCKRGRKPGSKAEAEPKTKTTEINRDYRDYEREKNESANAPQIGKPSIDQKKKVTNQPQPTKEQEKKPAIVLTPEAQAVYDEWCKMPWFKAPPPLTETTAAHCQSLAPYKPTAEVMLKVKNWATSKEIDRNGFYKNKAWILKFVLNELPKWLSTQPTIDPTAKPELTEEEKQLQAARRRAEETRRRNREKMMSGMQGRKVS